ncbi:putative ABC transport system substrate-binding protein [Bradyrhizobium erythrophlei]|jgi:putative ABC transport system substrate-binding protein|uniref:Putative ABC transport system substrate-binding protein n=2 Tax=Bradyrhizobium erythrophlei TaxID=1437360 RepID=A0A1M5JNF7_9BRAD|nr:putative ABC transport system substrate-binding protein [Bradyrhizobium erythrophlei]
MRRREFIVLSGSAAAWPLAARAQQSGDMRRVCVLMGIAESDPAQRSLVSAFTQGLQGLGWVPGRNIRIDYRWGAGDADKIQSFAREFVEQKPDLIIGHTSPVVAALKQLTSTISIVFTQVSDPVGSHFVDGLARPGGNITGFTNLEASMGSKLMELLKEVAPQTSRIALMFNPATSPDGGSYFLRPVEVAAPKLKLVMLAAPVHSPAEIESTMVSLAREPNSGLIVMPDIFILAHREQIIALADRYRLPAAYAYRLFPASGGLMSYGTDLVDLFRRAAPYVDRILKGEKPADLPVQTPTKYELVINLKTAKALGVTVPPSLLARVDEVIE